MRTHSSDIDGTTNLVCRGMSVASAEGGREVVVGVRW